MLDVNHMVTLNDLSSSDLHKLLQEAKSKLQDEELNMKDKKVYTLRIMLIKSILKERQNIECKGEISKWVEE